MSLPVQKKAPSAYATLEQIMARKDELREELQADSDKFGTLWSGLFQRKEHATRGEMVSSLVSNSITAIDAFLVVRKLMKNYGHLFKRRRR